ncbi:hypothetical protein BDR03DRAFT_976326 [Suillus americanus]|nr:hypothetical protein BDR03DRAFT_976326 [Suillus americanus]
MIAYSSHALPSPGASRLRSPGKGRQAGEQGKGEGGTAEGTTNFSATDHLVIHSPANGRDSYICKKWTSHRVSWFFEIPAYSCPVCIGYVGDT